MPYTKPTAISAGTTEGGTLYWAYHTARKNYRQAGFIITEDVKKSKPNESEAGRILIYFYKFAPNNYQVS